MAQLSSRDQLKDYCLRKLGFPVINIEIDDQQIEDRIDDALEFMFEYNYNLVERKYLAVQITQTDIDNGYVSMPVGIDVLAVSRILPLRNSGTNANYLFDMEYHITANEVLRSVGTGDASYFYIVKQHLATIADIFNARSMHEFRRYTDKLYFEFDPSVRLAPDQYIVLECHVPIDSSSRFWNDRVLRNYATALLKRQWGQNLSKYNEVQLPGGVKLNGWQIIEEANREIQFIEEDAYNNRFGEPLGFYMG